jgi:hypothetical protein
VWSSITVTTPHTKHVIIILSILTEERKDILKTRYFCRAHSERTLNLAGCGNLFTLGKPKKAHDEGSFVSVHEMNVFFPYTSLSMS